MRIALLHLHLLDPEKRSALADLIPTLKVKELAKEFDAGVMTVADILEQFKRPGRDPRNSSSGPIFKKGVMKIEDLKPGMELTGTVLNVYTRPACRRRGYGRAVMKALLAEAQAMELCSVELKATEDGVPLYKAVGFEDDSSEYRLMKWKNRS